MSLLLNGYEHWLVAYGTIWSEVHKEVWLVLDRQAKMSIHFVFPGVAEALFELPTIGKLGLYILPKPVAQMRMSTECMVPSPVTKPSAEIRSMFPMMV